jgi:nicotinate-nucleotide pyrophosphorylase (carboxylating)
VSREERASAGPSPDDPTLVADLAPLPPLLYEPLVRAALVEDLGRAGDVTTDAVVPAGLGAEAEVVARAAGRVAGLDVAAAAFHLLDPSLVIEPVAADGEDVEAGAVLLRVSGAARSILTAERVALNFLGHLCGVATATRDVARAVAAVAPRARVVETRKTTPGLRALEKHAVRAGGGANHRFGLDDAVLIKDNHLALAAAARRRSGGREGSIAAAVRAARARTGHLVKVEVEVDTLEQLEEALAAGVDAVLLDNMDLDTLRRAVERVGGRAVTEASGGITPKTAPAIAATGVDLLSIGWLTHSVKSLDVALDVITR